MKLAFWRPQSILAFSLRNVPLPVPNFGHVLAVFVDVLLVSDQLIFELLFQVDSLLSGLRQTINGVHHEVEAVEIVQHRHVECCGDRALFLVATNMDVGVVVSTVSQPMDQPRISVEGKDYRFVHREQFVEIPVA